MSSSMTNSINQSSASASPTYLSENTTIRFPHSARGEYDDLDPNTQEEIYLAIKNNCKTTTGLSPGGSLTRDSAHFPVINAAIMMAISKIDFFDLNTPQVCKPIRYGIPQDLVNILNTEINASPDKERLLHSFRLKTIYKQTGGNLNGRIHSFDVHQIDEINLHFNKINSKDLIDKEDVKQKAINEAKAYIKSHLSSKSKKRSSNELLEAEQPNTKKPRIIDTTESTPSSNTSMQQNESNPSNSISVIPQNTPSQNTHEAPFQFYDLENPFGLESLFDHENFNNINEAESESFFTNDQMLYNNNSMHQSGNNSSKVENEAKTNLVPEPSPPVDEFTESLWSRSNEQQLSADEAEKETSTADANDDLSLPIFQSSNVTEQPSYWEILDDL